MNDKLGLNFQKRRNANDHVSKWPNFFLKIMCTSSISLPYMSVSLVIEELSKARKNMSLKINS